jgi:hypothetical protein
LQIKRRRKNKIKSWRMLKNFEDWGALEEEEENTYRERG